MIELRRVALHAGAFRLEQIDLRLERGERALLLGPSGAGKTSLLEAICGLRPVAAGAITVDGLDVSRTPPSRLSIGYLPQDNALFDTMSVRENLGYALRRRGWPRPRSEERVEEVAGLLGLSGLLDRRPGALSGGEARRVALGRAIAFGPSALLLDEPLTGLDEATRAGVVDALQAAAESTGATVIHVSHDPRDADTPARRLRLAEGRLVDERAAASRRGPGG
ncbi:ATP-binding cassette domain-containing protein [Botrimarina sp.]|uniref:ATP-binding cassette domain-containing protein n=1 Tax=Botrimarina sp. TaxID=2795802 RepID=UPI0032EAEB45